MRLPNGDQAVLEVPKLRDYCLSQSHPLGKHKAKVFASALGITFRDSEALREAILAAAKTHEAVPTTADQFGQRYVLDMTLYNGELKAVVRTAWIVRTGEGFPRFITCYII